MTFDLLTLGRVSMDLFSLDIGAPFEEINAFDTGVGGSPTNIAIGASRLGLNVGALTAVGDGRVGDFVLKFLQDQHVDTRFIPRKPGALTGLAVLGIEPPDQFPLVFYRENPADIHLSIDDLASVPIAESRALLLSGTALSRGTCRDATLYAAQVAGEAATSVYIDLDVRPDQWSHPRAYGLNVRTILAASDVIIGTEEEFYAALAPNPDPIMAGRALTEAMRNELENMLQAFGLAQRQKTLVVKRGPHGVSVLNRSNAIDVAGFPVEIVNTVGAGDAFASGLIYARLQGMGWEQAARFANACGAIVVTRNGCAKAMPYRGEVDVFLQSRGETL